MQHQLPGLFTVQGLVAGAHLPVLQHRLIECVLHGFIDVWRQHGLGRRHDTHFAEPVPGVVLVVGISVVEF